MRRLRQQELLREQELLQEQERRQVREQELLRVQERRQVLEEQLRRRNQQQQLLGSKRHHASIDRKHFSKHRRKRYASCGFLERQRQMPIRR